MAIVMACDCEAKMARSKSYAEYKANGSKRMHT